MCVLFFFFFSCVSVTEVGKLLGILPEADWALYVCHKAPGSLPLVSIVLFPCLDALHFGRDPNPLFHLLSLSCLFSLPHHPPRFPPSSSFLHHPSLQSLSVLLLFALHDLPRNIKHVNSVCLKLGFGRRDQRCHNRITVPNHMGPPGTVRHPSLWCVCEEKVFLCVYAESSLSALFSSSCCVCTFLHILLLPPQKITLCFFCLPATYVWGFFLYILASSTLYLLSPRSTESLDVFCWSCSVLRLNPLCTQQPVFLVSCTGGGSS